MAAIKRFGSTSGTVESVKRVKLTSNNESQSRFIIGMELSGSAHSSQVVNSPIKSRWSRHTTRNSPTKSSFSQIRNRSYTLGVSPQQQPPITRARKSNRVGVGRRAINFGHDRLNASLNSSGQSEGENNTSEGLDIATSTEVNNKHPRRAKATKTSRKPTTTTVVSVLKKDTTKWTPVREQAKSLLHDSITHSSSLVKVNRKSFGKHIETVVTKVKRELVTATAPKTGRLKSYYNLHSKIEALKESLSVLAQHNNDIDEKLETLKSHAKGRLAKAKNISGGIPSENVIPTSIEEGASTDQANKDWGTANDFHDYLIDLVQRN